MRQVLSPFQLEMVMDFLAQYQSMCDGQAVERPHVCHMPYMTNATGGWGLLREAGDSTIKLRSPSARPVIPLVLHLSAAWLRARTQPLHLRLLTENAEGRCLLSAVTGTVST